MISVKNLNKYYNKGLSNELHVLQDVSLKIEDGSMAAIVGKSGAGKSTLLHILGAIDAFDSGTVVIGDTALQDADEKQRAAFRNRSVGFVMQDFALIPDFSTIENVMLPLLFQRMPKKLRVELAMKALERVGLRSFAKNPITQLSGGEKQRVAIARAIVTQPSYLLADEPTGALDSKTAGELMGLLVELNRGGMTIIIITHDESIAAYCQRVLTIADGKVRE